MQPKNKTVTMALPFPFKGQHAQDKATGQPLETSPSMLNVWPFDWRSGKRRGAQRPGLNRAHPNAIPLGSPNVINCITSAIATNGIVYCALVAGGNVYAAGTSLAALIITTGGTAQLTSNASPAPGVCDLFGEVYFVDGVNGIKKLTLATATTTTHAASVGTLPTNPTICANFRGRLVLSGVAADPQNIFMSRAGTTSDFDYGKSDALAAVALNASTAAGRIGARVFALMPFTADNMLIGCEDSLLVMKGDPADGGSILTVSDGVGAHSRDAWCIDPAGNVYFLGTNGFFRYSRDGSLDNLSAGRMEDFFGNIPRTYRVVMCWDRQRNGCYLFATPYASGAGTGVFYSLSEDGFFPTNVPDACGPHALNVFDPLDGVSRAVLFGGRDGFLRKLDKAAFSDDGTAVSASVNYGPIRPEAGGPLGDSVLTQTSFTLGDNAGTTNMVYKIRGHKDPNLVDDTPALHQTGGTMSGANRRVPSRTRVRGQWFYVALSNAVLNANFNIEEIALTFEGGGRVR